MKRYTLLALALLIALATTLQAETLTRVAAVVNSEVITTYQLDQAVNEVLAQRGQLEATKRSELKAALLDKLINDKLVEQHAAQLRISVPAAEIDSAVKEIRINNGLSEEDLAQAIEERGLTMDSYRKQVKSEILRYKVLNREVRYKVLVTSHEVRRYYDEHLDEYGVAPQVSIYNMAFPADSDPDRIAAARKELSGQRSFSEIAETFSEATSNDMGTLSESDLIPALKTAIIGLEKGEVSEPVNLGGQTHLFLVTERSSGKEATFERVKGQIEAQLREEKTNARFAEWRNELSSSAQIEKRL